MAEVCTRPSPNALHTSFLLILPRIRLHGRVAFRGVRCAHAKEEGIAEMVAVCWRWFVRLAGRGKDASDFPSALATYAARAVKSGRRLCGQHKTRDVFSEQAQQSRGFVVSSLPGRSTLEGNLYDDALCDNTQSPVPEQVAFRIDFPAWRRTHAPRNRKMLDDLMRGEPTFAVARKYGVSAARVSQLRSHFHDDWRKFCGEWVPGQKEMSRKAA
jgi:hypothetical protein